LCGGFGGTNGDVFEGGLELVDVARDDDDVGALFRADLAEAAAEALRAARDEDRLGGRLAENLEEDGIPTRPSTTKLFLREKRPIVTRAMMGTARIKVRGRAADSRTLVMSGLLRIDLDQINRGRDLDGYVRIR
jgi:hypothetical protein